VKVSKKKKGISSVKKKSLGQREYGENLVNKFCRVVFRDIQDFSHKPTKIPAKRFSSLVENQEGARKRVSNN